MRKVSTACFLSSAESRLKKPERHECKMGAVTGVLVGGGQQKRRVRK
jgi:hypothetical protein